MRKCAASSSRSTAPASRRSRNFLSASSSGVLKLFGVSLSRAQPVSEEEIKVMIDQGIEHGMFEEAERDMIEGVFVNHTVYDLGHYVMPSDEVAFVPYGTPGPHRFYLGLYKAGKQSRE